MFNKRKNKVDSVDEKQNNSFNKRILDFEKLISAYINKNGVNTNIQEQSDKQELLIKSLLENLGFFDNIEHIIIEQWLKAKSTNENVSPQEFVKLFIQNFHNTLLEKVVPNFITERNKKLLEAYNNILKSIEQIQAWFNEQELRTRIESDFRDKPYVFSTISQSVTPFCIISLGCDQVGRYNIVYSIDYRFQEILSENFANKLIRNIYKFTSGDIEASVKIGSLYNDCISVFKQLSEKLDTEPYHKKITIEKHDIDK